MAQSINDHDIIVDDEPNDDVDELNEDYEYEHDVILRSEGSDAA